MDCTAIWKLDKTLPFDKQIEMSREYFEYMLELSRAEYEENFPFIEAQSPRYFVFPMTSMGYNKSGIPSIDMPYISGNARGVNENIRVTCRKAVERPAIPIGLKRVYFP